MISRPYKAYGGYIAPGPYENECRDAVDKLPQFKGVEWPLSLLAKAYRTTGIDGNATLAQQQERRRLINECIERKKNEPYDILDASTIWDKIPSNIPLPWLVAGGLGILVIVLLVTRK